MSDRLHCPGCGIPTIEGGVDTTEEELYCNRCVEELERNMSTNKPVGGAQFTPGPWKVVHDNAIDATYIVPVKPCDSHALARVYRNHPEYEDNAAFIAAAPAMYEALKEWCDYYAAYNPIRDKRIEPFIQLTRKALAQAEGKAL